MNKLQLYLAMSKKGTFQRKLDVNPDEYVSSWISDLHDVVSQVDYSLAGKSVFYMVKYIDTGVFVTVIRTIAGPVGDHLACWIYMPYGTRISEAEFAQTVKYITDKAALSDIKPTDIAQMRSHFAREYESELVPTIFAPSSGLSTAYRYYGQQYGCEINDLIGKYLYQTAYIPYAGILLVSCSVTGDIAGRDLSILALEPMGVLHQPEPNSDGYEPYIYDQLFDQPFYVPLNRKIDIVWRKGKSEIPQPVYVTKTGTTCPPLNKPLQQPEQEKADEVDPVDDVDNTVIPQEPKAQPAQTATEPEPAPRTQYSNPNSDLPQRKKSYFFYLPAKSASMGSVIEFEISTQSDITESPIDGYEPTGEIREGSAHRNHLVYTADNKAKKILANIMWCLIGLAVGALTMVLIDRWDSFGFPSDSYADTLDITNATITDVDGAPTNVPSEQKPADNATSAKQATEQTTAQAAPAQADLPAEISLDAAIAYLDNNRSWTKSKLEQFPDLKGLYDDLNTFNRERVVNFWREKLKESRNFKNVAHHTELSLKAHKKPRTPGNRKTYNAPSDESINVQGYLNAVDP